MSIQHQNNHQIRFEPTLCISWWYEIHAWFLVQKTPKTQQKWAALLILNACCSRRFVWQNVFFFWILSQACENLASSLQNQICQCCYTCLFQIIRVPCMNFMNFQRAVLSSKRNRPFLMVSTKTRISKLDFSPLVDAFGGRKFGHSNGNALLVHVRKVHFLTSGPTKIVSDCATFRS